MKKYKILILSIFCLLLIGCTSNSNESKEIGNTSDFENVAINNEFTVLDSMSSYTDVNYIFEAKKATLDDIVIEMIIYDNEENTKKVQEDQIKAFKTIKNTAVPENTEEGKNYYKFWMVSNGYYMVSSRIDNTLVFCKTLLTNKEKVEKILKEINY